MNPFTGNGFMLANGKDAHGKERLGTPEVVAKPPQPVDKAVIVRIDSEGNEVIVGYSVERKINGKKVKQFVLKEKLEHEDI